MAGLYAQPVQDLIDELGRLPGIGPKSAQRVAFHLLKLPEQDAMRLATAIREAKQKVQFCNICFNISEGDECEMCTDPRRDDSVICVVEEAKDIVSVERTQGYNGRYHVLQGAMNPIEGIGPEQLRVTELIGRLKNPEVKEVILCTNPNMEGEATSLYLARLLGDSDLTITRLASGLPVGGDLEYADELTLGRALEGRQSIET